MNADATERARADGTGPRRHKSLDRLAGGRWPPDRRTPSVLGAAATSAIRNNETVKCHSTILVFDEQHSGQSAGFWSGPGRLSEAPVVPSALI